MTEREYVKAVDKLLDQILPQAGKLVLDIGLVNDLAMETSRRLRREILSAKSRKGRTDHE